MPVLFWILATLSGFVGFILLATAKNAVHEIQGFLLFLIAAVLMSAAAILSAIKKVNGPMKRETSGAVETKPDSTTAYPEV